MVIVIVGWVVTGGVENTATEDAWVMSSANALLLLVFGRGPSGSARTNWIGICRGNEPLPVVETSVKVSEFRRSSEKLKPPHLTNMANSWPVIGPRTGWPPVSDRVIVAR